MASARCGAIHEYEMVALVGDKSRHSAQLVPDIITTSEESNLRQCRSGRLRITSDGGDARTRMWFTWMADIEVSNHCIDSRTGEIARQFLKSFLSVRGAEGRLLGSFNSGGPSAAFAMTMRQSAFT